MKRSDFGFVRKSITFIITTYTHYHRPQHGGALSGHVTIGIFL